MRHSIRTLAIAGFAATALAATALTPAVAWAEEATGGSPDPAVTASQAGAASADLSISQDGYNAMRDIRAARVAIFNGAPDLAKQFVEDAQVALGLAKSSEGLLTKQGDASPGNWVVVDGQLLVADNYTTSPEKTASIQKSNEALKYGDAATALQTLKDAQIDVGFTRILMPIAETQSHVDTALASIDVGQYYQANLALKAAEDGLNVNTIMLFDNNPPSGSTTSADNTAGSSN